MEIAVFHYTGLTLNFGRGTSWTAIYVIQNLYVMHTFLLKFKGGSSDLGSKILQKY